MRTRKSTFVPGPLFLVLLIILMAVAGLVVRKPWGPMISWGALLTYLLFAFFARRIPARMKAHPLTWSAHTGLALAIALVVASMGLPQAFMDLVPPFRGIVLIEIVLTGALLFLLGVYSEKLD